MKKTKLISLVIILFAGLSCAKAQKETMYVNGVQWGCENKENITVCVSYSSITMHEAINYYVVDVFVKNNSENEIELTPDNIQVYNYSKKGKVTELKTWTKKEFDKRLKTMSLLEEGLEGFNSGGGSRSEREINSLVMKMGSENRDSQRKVIQQGYLGRTTLFPQDKVSGYIYADKKKGDELEVTMQIGTVPFSIMIKQE